MPVINAAGLAAHHSFSRLVRSSIDVACDQVDNGDLHLRDVVEKASLNPAFDS